MALETKRMATESVAISAGFSSEELLLVTFLEKETIKETGARREGKSMDIRAKRFNAILSAIREILAAGIFLHYSYFKSKSSGLIKMGRGVYTPSAFAKEYKGPERNWTLMYAFPPLTTTAADLRSFRNAA